MGWKIYNKKTGNAINVYTLPGQKRTSLIMSDEIGFKKVAAFLSDEDAEDFVRHMATMIGVKVGEEHETD